MELSNTQTWLAELDRSVADGDLTQYRATCAVLAEILKGGHPPEVNQLFEEYMKCHSV